MRLCEKIMEIYTVGGFSEVGRNMTAVKVGDDAVILDMGIYLPKIIDFEEEGGERNLLDADTLIKIGAIPNDRVLEPIKDKVRAIVIGHCHLDHLAAVPFLANKYSAPVIGTPYTIQILKNELKEGLKINNPLEVVESNSSYKAGDIEIELIHITHSTPQSTMIALHTKEGIIVYANDFKFDNYPVLEKEPNYHRLKQLGEKGVKALIVESLYAHEHRKTPSEKVAKEMLKEVLLDTKNKNNGVFITTFASHIARLDSIVEYGKKMGRKIVFLGRSLDKYTKSAEDVGLVNFSNVDIVGYKRKVKKKLKVIDKKGRENYLVVCTGNQAEPRSILNELANDSLPLKFREGDNVIFSSRTIPVPINIRNREKLESTLKKKKVRIFKEIHVSGHASREDFRDLIDMLKPEHIFPSHGPEELQKNLADLAKEMGYSLGKNVHLSKNGERFEIKSS